MAQPAKAYPGLADVGGERGLTQNQDPQSPNYGGIIRKVKKRDQEPFEPNAMRAVGMMGHRSGDAERYQHEIRSVERDQANMQAERAAAEIEASKDRRVSAWQPGNRTREILQAKYGR
jgi:hypothetical protein